MRSALTDKAFPPKPRLIEGGVRDGQWEIDCRKWADDMDRWGLALRPFFEEEQRADDHRDLMRDYQKHDGPPPRSRRVRVADAVARFERHCINKRRIKPRTWRGYMTGYNVLIEWASFEYMDEFDSTEWDDFVDALLDRGLSDATIFHYCAAVRSLCRFLTRRGEMPFDPTQDEMPSQPKYSKRERLAKVMDDEACAAIMASEDDRAPVFKLLMTTGMRPCELARVTLADVDLGDKVVGMDGEGHPHLYIPGYKKGPEREVPLTPEMVGWVRQLIAAGHSLRGKGATPVSDKYADRILGISSHCLCVGWWRQFRDSIPELDSPIYSMRHTVVTWLVRQYDVHIAGLMVGHSQGTLTGSTYWHPSRADTMGYATTLYQHFAGLDKSGIQEKTGTG